MKKMISLLLALALALTLCACVTPKTPMPIEDGDKSAAQPVTVRLGGLKGPTSMGMVKLLDDAESGATENGYAFTMAASANELTPQLVQGELDIVAVPANVAAILYNQTEGGVELLAAGTLGVLYMVEKGGETVTDVASLSGKTIYATGKGATPEYALTYLLSQHGLTLGTDVQVEWKSEPTEIVALMAEQENVVAMLPQPFVTVAQGQVEGLRVALDLSEEWDKLDNGSRLITSVLVARKAFADEHPAAVRTFLSEYAVKSLLVRRGRATLFLHLPTDAVHLCVSGIRLQILHKCLQFKQQVGKRSRTSSLLPRLHIHKPLRIEAICVYKTRKKHTRQVMKMPPIDV